MEARFETYKKYLVYARLFYFQKAEADNIQWSKVAGLINEKWVPLLGEELEEYYNWIVQNKDQVYKNLAGKSVDDPECVKINQETKIDAFVEDLKKKPQFEGTWG